MSEVAPQPEPAPTSGMWAPYVPPEIGEPLDTLAQVPAFVLVDAKVREPVDVTFDGTTSKRTPVDLRVQTTDPNVTRLFSGFAAGVVGRVKRMQAGDLPAVVKLVDETTPRGRTLGLALVQAVAAGADLAAIAKSLPTPMMPTGSPDGEIPY
jgi:hypothetical protein